MLQSPVDRAWIHPSSGFVLKYFRLRPRTWSWLYFSSDTTIYPGLSRMWYQGLEGLRELDQQLFLSRPVHEYHHLMVLVPLDDVGQNPKRLVLQSREL